MKKYGAEFFGTFWLVLGGCGSAVLAAAFPNVGIGLLGVSLAFGLTVLTMAFAIGHISGCHLNPAVSVGLWAGGRFPAKELLPYIVAQVLGAVVAGGVLYLIASGKADGQFHRICVCPGLNPGACRALGVKSENAPQRGQFLPDLPPHSGAMGQEDGKNGPLRRIRSRRFQSPAGS